MKANKGSTQWTGCAEADIKEQSCGAQYGCKEPRWASRQLKGFLHRASAGYFAHRSLKIMSLQSENLASKAGLGDQACVQLHSCQVLLKSVAPCQGVDFHKEDTIPSSLAEEKLKCHLHSLRPGP